MALLHTGDRICASCGGMNGQHRPGCIGDESVEVISVYTRQQAIDDGILVDCEQAPMGEMRRQLMKWPLAMTATAFHRYVWPMIGEGEGAPTRTRLSGCHVFLARTLAPGDGDQLQPSEKRLARIVLLAQSAGKQTRDRGPDQPGGIG